jgi:diacylglycerol kinase (ATP)
MVMSYACPGPKPPVTRRLARCVSKAVAGADCANPARFSLLPPRDVHVALPRSLPMNDARSAAWQVNPVGTKPTFALAARLRSFAHALRGMRAVLASQHNAWLHAAATCVVVVAGLGLDVSRFEWLALLFAIVSVWTAETLNTAFEALCDVASPQFHPLVARAKDVAAGAVLICAVGAVVTAGLVFGPHLAQHW